LLWCHFDPSSRFSFHYARSSCCGATLSPVHILVFIMLGALAVLPLCPKHYLSFNMLGALAVVPLCPKHYPSFHYARSSFCGAPLSQALPFLHYARRSCCGGPLSQAIPFFSLCQEFLPWCHFVPSITLIIIMLGALAVVPLCPKHYPGFHYARSSCCGATLTQALP